MKRIIFITAFLTLVTAVAYADIARPSPAKTPVQKTKKSIETGMSIRLDRDAKEARLIIPRSQIKQLRAELEQMDGESDDTAAVTTPGGLSRTQTIVSGMFMSLALVFGGMWFVRSGRAQTRAGKAVVALVIVTAIGSAATFVYANAGPPPEARSITGKMFTEAVHSYGTGWGTVKLEAGDDPQIVLIVPDPKDKPKPSGDE